MLKRVDVAVYNAFKDAQDGDFATGFSVLGVAEEGVGYAMDENNAPLVSADMQAAVDAAAAKIASGELAVPANWPCTTIPPTATARPAKAFR
jgi:basic membrane protein A